MDTSLWSEFEQVFSSFRKAFSRETTYLWCAIACAGLAIRTDLRGVTSIVSVMGLQSASYFSLLRAFHSSAFKQDQFLACWIQLILQWFTPACLGGRMLLICDGINIAKEGKKMPGVKLLHQHSSSNTKPSFIMGHYLQSISIAVVGRGGEVQAIPITAKIHDGIIRTHRGAKTRIHKMVDLIKEICGATNLRALVIADAYYAVRNMAKALVSDGHHLISRVKNNAVAYADPEPVSGPNKRGRPRKYGKKIKLSDMHEEARNSEQVWEGHRYVFENLLWKPLGAKVRFVACHHPEKGSITLISTDESQDPQEIIQSYILRWKIETGFKTAKHTFGSFCYHFWAKCMEPTKKQSKGIDLVGQTQEARDKIERKIEAFHAFILLSYVANGICLYLANTHPEGVWAKFSGWLRQMDKSKPPSEIVVKNALATDFNYFRTSTEKPSKLKNMILKHFDQERPGFWQATG